MDEQHDRHDDQADSAPGSRMGGFLRNGLLLALFTSSGSVLSLLPDDLVRALQESPFVRLLTAGDAPAAAAWLGLGLLAAAGVVWGLQRGRDDPGPGEPA